MILITGANGLLGKEFRKKLTTNQAFFPNKLECDISNTESLNSFIKDKEITAIINCAANRDAETLELSPEKSKAINVIGPYNLALLSNRLKCPLIHYSSDYVFDGMKNKAYTEEDKTNPCSFYGKQKIESEKIVLETAKTAIIIRTAWVFSAHGKDFVKTIYSLARKKQEINVIFDQVGSPCWGDDLAKHTLEILPKIKENTREVYHLTNEGVCSWYDLACLTVKQFKIDCVVNPIHTYEFEQQAKRPFYSVLDKTKIKKEFDIKIDHYVTALEKCIEEIKSS